MYVSLVLSLCLSAFTSKAQQQPLDSTFGDNGIALLPEVDGFYGVDISLQHDNKILALYNGNCGHGFLCRLMPDGSLDPTFVPIMQYQTWPVFYPGVIEMQGHACNPNSSAVRQLKSGKILLVIAPEAIVQYNADGTNDSSFGNNSFTSIISYTNLNPLAPRNTMDLIEIPGSGVLFAGSSMGSFMSDSLSLAMMKYDGSMDANFGTGGYMKVPLPPSQVGSSSQIWAARFLPGNRILVAGSSIFTGSATMRDVFLAMYTTTGTLVTSFGNNGVKLISRNANYEDAWDLEYLDDNNIYLMASTYAYPDNAGTRYVCKFNAQGVIDNNFANNGFAVWPHISYNGNTAFIGAVTPDNFVYTASDSGTSRHYTYLSYNKDGVPNTQFTSNGIYSTANYDKVTKMIAQPDNKLLLLGSDEYHPRLMRFKANTITGVPELAPKPGDVSLWSTGKDAYWTFAEGSGQKDFHLNIFSIDGKMIHSYNKQDCIATSKSGYSVALPGGLPSGIYVLQLITTEKQVTIKVAL